MLDEPAVPVGHELEKFKQLIARVAEVGKVQEKVPLLELLNRNGLRSKFLFQEAWRLNWTDIRTMRWELEYIFSTLLISGILGPSWNCFS